MHTPDLTSAGTEPAAAQFVVRPVRSSRDFKRFVDFSYLLYRDHPYWVPPLRAEVIKSLNPKKNPFFEHGRLQAFLAEDEKGEIVGRVAAIVNGMHLKKYEDQTGFFGFFECKQDYGIAEQLLDTAGDWLKDQGLTHVRGPVNPSMNDIAGLLVGGFDQYPSFMMPYNPPYYEKYLLNYGFHRAMTMWAYYIHYKYVRIERMRRGYEILRKRYPDVQLRTIDMSRFEEEARVILDIYNEAWEKNWGHVPMTEAEFLHLAKDMKQIIDPSIVYLLENEEEIFAFSISLPNINQALKHVKGGRLLPTGLFQLLLRAKFGGINEGRTLLMGVRQKYQGKGFDALLNFASIEGLPKSGYFGSEMSWVLDNNKPMMNAMVEIGGAQDKQYAMFEKTL